MKTHLLLIAGVIACIAAIKTHAAVPLLTSYQGRVQVAGVDFNGTGQFKFVLLGKPGDVSLWSNDGTSVDGSEPTAAVSLNVSDGLFTVLLGDNSLPNMTPLTADIFSANSDVCLRIWFDDGVNGSILLAPDTRLTSVPYAFAADIPNGSITPGKLSVANAPQMGRLLSYDGLGFDWVDLSEIGNIWALNGSDTYYTAGNVGVGTSTPATKLTVSSIGYGIEHTDGTRRLSTYLSGTGGWLGTRTSDPLNFYVNDGGASMTIHTSGRVGIGTTTPASRLTVQTTGILSAYGIEHTDGTVRLSTFLDGTGGWLGTRTSHALNFYVNDDLPSLAVEANGNVVITPNGGNGGYGSTIFGAPNGESGLSIRGDNAGANRADLRFNGNSVKLVAGPGIGPPGFTSGIAVTTAGNVGIGTDVPESKLDVRGTTRTCVLTITGGCDLAEPFPLKERELEKGSVVVIDDEHPGQLRLSTRACDRRVAGIISGANGVNTGIALQQAGTFDQGQNVALSGRVYVRADAAFGAITPGDMLTTSDTPGHAMKVTDHAQAQGAILGKAMSGLKAGQGFVLVLVTLQ